MRPKYHPALLRQIAEIRSLQRLAAENVAERAAASLRQKQQATDAAERECLRIEANWSAVLASPSFSPDLAGAWSAALLRQTTAARQARSEIGPAEADLDQRKRASHIAMAYEDVAKEWAEAISRDWRRYHDQSRVMEMAERFAQRRWRR